LAIKNTPWLPYPPPKLIEPCAPDKHKFKASKPKGVFVVVEWLSFGVCGKGWQNKTGVAKLNTAVGS